MSINVTVSGNPVRINRGKMIISDKNESERRRLMRLEQVRQQSKDIAETLRNRVKSDKAKQQSQLEKEGEIKLKNWQARKLLELQDQYQEALGEIGLGHKNAREVEKEEEEFSEQQEMNERVARERGIVAATKSQIEKNEVSLKRAMPLQRKKIVRDFENQRAMKRSVGKKKTKHIDSDSENIIPELEIDETSLEPSHRIHCDKEQQTSNKVSQEQQTSIQVVTTDAAAQTTINESVPPTTKPTILDTRISDRIKRRQIIRDLTPEVSEPPCCQCSQQPEKIVQTATKVTQTLNVEIPSVPSKPKVTLTSKDRPTHPSTGDRVQHYDHPNRFSKTYTTKSIIEKIDDEQLRISPNILSDEEIKEKMKRRDLEAEVRGQVALEKEKIQREYNELLKKLPILQKQERILEIGEDRERYHMSNDRLEEREKKRQNRLDNAYEELFVRQPALVTLPKQKNDTRLNLAESKSRSDELTRLLSDLKSQKQVLLREMESLDDVKSNSTDYPRSVSNKRKRSGTVSPISTLKKKRKKKILQSMGTQTVQSVATSPIININAHSVATSPIVTDTPDCVCNSKDEMCEIVIKLNKDEKPEIQVNPPFQKSVRVVEEKIESPEDSKRGTSWREELSQNHSTSTSYMEPPSSGRTERQKIVIKKKTSPPTEQKLDPRLLTYIKKLLNMSRASIDDLSVSAATEVSTPSHSVLETPSNNPIMQLMNVMRYFNLDAAEVQKQLSYVSDESSKHYNTSESVTVSSDVDAKTQYKSCTEIDGATRTFQRYSDIAESCSRKISDLSAKIEQVRAEKKKMLESTSSESDRDLTVTSYKDLPEKNDVLKIDYEYANKLKEEQKSKQLSDDELLNRLKNLLKDNKRVVQTTTKKTVTEHGKKPIAVVNTQTVIGQTENGKTAAIVTDNTKVSLPTEKPFFLDIPKLPRLEAPSLDKRKKKPPPSKALKVIGNTLPPHELSTIVEADSQISTKLESNSSDETMETMLTSIGMEWAIPTLKKTREALAMTSSSSGGDQSLREFLSRISSSGESQIDNRRTSTPIGGGKREEFLTESDISSVRKEEFFDLDEEELSKTH